MRVRRSVRAARARRRLLAGCGGAAEAQRTTAGDRPGGAAYAAAGNGAPPTRPAGAAAFVRFFYARSPRPTRPRQHAASGAVRAGCSICQRYIASIDGHGRRTGSGRPRCCSGSGSPSRRPTMTPASPGRRAVRRPGLVPLRRARVAWSSPRPAGCRAPAHRAAQAGRAGLAGAGDLVSRCSRRSWCWSRVASAPPAGAAGRLPRLRHHRRGRRGDDHDRARGQRPRPGRGRAGRPASQACRRDYSYVNEYAAPTCGGNGLHGDGVLCAAGA